MKLLELKSFTRHLMLLCMYQYKLETTLTFIPQELMLLMLALLLEVLKMP